MNIDRAIGVFGLIISIIGIVNIEKLDMGWAITSIGVTLILYFVYIELRPSMTNLYFNFVYDFTENDKGITSPESMINFLIKSS